MNQIDGNKKNMNKFVHDIFKHKDNSEIMVNFRSYMIIMITVTTIHTH